MRVERGMHFKEREENFVGDGNIILIVVMVLWEYTYVKPQQIVHFNYVQFIKNQ